MKALMAIAGAGLFAMFVAGTQAQQQAQGQAPAGGAQSYFVGGTPSRVPSDKLSTSRLKFPKGSRSNWHTHANGQLLMVEEGKALTQERGGPVREMGVGQPWFTKGGVEHWHGATPDADLVQLTIYDQGDVKWLEPVTDQQYHATPRK
jgi:quercetin dioxygenase-like cupin family protein